MSDKTVRDAGADEKTPSIPQYFSWINNTNEGSTERQTLINLDFFDWLYKTYGMRIKIYAWDAGNFDGSSHGYGDVDGEKFRSQYPNGYAKIVERAAKSGIRMGLWGSPDGFGDTPEAEKKRYDFIVGLCRDYNFALFKFDGVCGGLREEKSEVFARMLVECRKYSPDLIVLNHRLNLYAGMKHATTFLWQGAETYVDVHSANSHTGMHNRCFIFERGLPDGLERLAEDHGVCLSSSMDYFEDDLIYQAFGRCMILAPEIYGNPWLLRDDEYAKLAEIFNLHRDNAAILVDGIALPASYGCSPVSRGSDVKRFLTTGNDSWTVKRVKIKLDGEIGLAGGKKVKLTQLHPVKKTLGVFDYGDTVEVALLPFRAHLFEAEAVSESYINITEKSTISENVAEFPPVPLGAMLDDPASLAKGETLCEAALFGADNDSLEARSLRRAGETRFDCVKAARDEFFGQLTYKARGCEGRYAFDGDDSTFFDGYSRRYAGGLRFDGGCMRVDFGEVYDCDEIVLTVFSCDEPTDEVPAQIIPERGEYSADLTAWRESSDVEAQIAEENAITPSVVFSTHYIREVKGKKLDLIYRVSGNTRYFRLPSPPDRVYSIRLFKNGEELKLRSPRVNNLFSPYSKKPVAAIKALTVTLPEILPRAASDLRANDYIAVALEGEHGCECAYCAAELDGEYLPFPSRAPAYQSNVWEHLVTRRSANHTYFMPVTPEMSGKTIKLYALLLDAKKTDVRPEVYLCAGH